MAWRASAGKPTSGALNAYKPIVAVGAEHALEDEELVEDHFRARNPLAVRLLGTRLTDADGADGLHGVHEAVSSGADPSFFLASRKPSDQTLTASAFVPL